MTRRIISITILLSLCAGVGFGCFTNNFIKPKQTDIDTYVKDNPDLPELDKSCLYDGRFEVGMKQETVRFLLGEPKKLEPVSQPWGMQERWIYKRGNNKIFYMEDKGVVAIMEE
jgi:hypothetical protein